MAGEHTSTGGSRRVAPRRRPARGSSTQSPSGTAPHGQRSDLSARLIAAVPAIAFALFIVIEGGLIFALGLFALGCICMHELYGMYDRAHPVRLAGFIALAGLLAAALYGGQFQILLVAVAALPMLFGLTLLQQRPSVGGMAVTLL